MRWVVNVSACVLWEAGVGTKPRFRGALFRMAEDRWEVALRGACAFSPARVGVSTCGFGCGLCVAGVGALD